MHVRAYLIAPYFLPVRRVELYHYNIVRSGVDGPEVPRRVADYNRNVARDGNTVQPVIPIGAVLPQ